MKRWYHHKCYSDENDADGEEDYKDDGKTTLNLMIAMRKTGCGDDENKDNDNDDVKRFKFTS